MTPDLNQIDVNNVLIVARRALTNLTGPDLVAIATSIANIEAAYQEKPKPLTEKSGETSDG